MPTERFRLSDEPLAATPPFSIPAGVGALVTFDGLVRDNNDGKPVTRLEYTAYPAVAHAEGLRIVAEAEGRFGLLGAACVHRIGVLAPGEVAVRVWAAAAHRTEAFAACAFIIDAVKAHVPIWKRETYADGRRTWVQCQGAHATVGA